MKQLIACCGINCENCEARIATLQNDDNLRKEVAEKWSVMFHSSEITPASINCTGCRMEGATFVYCESVCEIRKCVNSKGFGSCAECPEMNTCTIVGFILNAVPEAKDNLQQLLN